MSGVVPDYCEVLTGWRAWTVTPEFLPVELMSLNGDPWPARSAPAAQCAHVNDDTDDVLHPQTCPNCQTKLHVAPVPGCTCGYWAFKTREQLETSRLCTIDRIVGTVALWGKVQEHESGYRAQFAYPTAFYADADTGVRLARYGVPVHPREEAPVFTPPSLQEQLDATNTAMMQSLFTSTPLLSYLAFSRAMPIKTYESRYAVEDIAPEDRMILEPSDRELSKFGGRVGIDISKSRVRITKLTPHYFLNKAIS